MGKLLKRVVVLGSAGTAGWMFWSRRRSSQRSRQHSQQSWSSSPVASNGAASAGAWPPIPTGDAPSASSFGGGEGAGSATASTQPFAAPSEVAFANAQADAALEMADAALAAQHRAEAQAAAALDLAAAAVAAEEAAEVSAEIANAQAEAALDIAAAAIAAERAAEEDAAAARADLALSNATTDAALGFASNVANAAAQVDWNLKWVPPNDDGSCPISHPVKGNDGSKIYHVPEGRSYHRTKAERCYATPADAEADGYRQSKR